MKKSELRQIIREELSNISEISFSSIDRMEGLANINDLADFKVKLRILTTDWIEEGFEKEDVIEYEIEYLIKKINS
jgi:hypothetical protein